MKRPKRWRRERDHRRFEESVKALMRERKVEPVFHYTVERPEEAPRAPGSFPWVRAKMETMRSHGIWGAVPTRTLPPISPVWLMKYEPMSAGPG